MRRFFALGAAFFCAALIGETAFAQDQTWLNDRQYREGAGFRAGNFELHPGVGADFGYDSNYFRRRETEDPAGALRIRVSPSFSVTSLGPQRSADGPPPDFGFRFEVGGSYNEFIPVSGSQAAQDKLQEQRNFGGGAKLDLDIMPRRTWSGNVHGGIDRNIRPTEEGGPVDDFNRLLPQAGASITWAPGSGLLDWTLGYEFAGTFFESSSFSTLNSFRNDVRTRGRWRFLPRTALLYDASFAFVTYPNKGGASNKTDSHPLRARLGLNGLITPSFAVLALAGWGASFYTDDDQDFDSLIAHLELKWYLTPTPQSDPTKVSPLMSSVAVGFIRDYEDSYIGTHLERDQGFVRFNYLFGGAFLLVAEARGGAVVFPPQTNPDFGQPGGWTDMRVDGKLFGEYRFKDSFAVTAELGYTGYFSSTVLTFPTGNTGSDALGFQDITAFAGARWFM